MYYKIPCSVNEWTGSVRHAPSAPVDTHNNMPNHVVPIDQFPGAYKALEGQIPQDFLELSTVIEGCPVIRFMIFFVCLGRKTKSVVSYYGRNK